MYHTATCKLQVPDCMLTGIIEGISRGVCVTQSYSLEKTNRQSVIGGEYLHRVGTIEATSLIAAAMRIERRGDE